MKKILFCVVTVMINCCITIFHIDSFGQNGKKNIYLDYDCNMNTTEYVMIDTIALINELVDYGKTARYFHKNSQQHYMLITNEQNFELIRKSGTRMLDFEKYNLFVGLFERYSCLVDPLIKVSLYSDKKANDIAVSILMYQVPGPYLKNICPHLLISFPIRKTDINTKYCYKENISKQDEWPK